MARSTSPAKLSPRARLARVIVVLVALLGGAALSELGAGALRGFAFPYLNLFVADDTYGVRLLPDAATRTRSRSGRITRVRTNALGFRGPDWTGAPGGVLLLGDSQVFGYGVDEKDAFAAQLAEALDREILNAAVPTWGPTEYARAAQELVPRHRPAHVIFVANLANDWVEAHVPNTRRTTARDGWVHRARRDLSPANDEPSFVRDLLMRRSQLVFLARELEVVLREGGLPPNQSAELLSKLAERPPSGGAHASPLGRHLQAVREVCVRHGCQVTALVLPLDVMVSDAEWAKYRRPAARRVDLSGAATLKSAFVQDAKQLGVRSLDLEPVLRAASPGAFLADDYHLSPRGHAAIAAALAHALDSAPDSAPDSARDSARDDDTPTRTAEQGAAHARL